MKKVLFILLAIAAVSIWAIKGFSKNSTVTKVSKAEFESATSFASEVLKSAQERRGKQFLALAQNPEQREALQESFWLLNAIKPPEKSKWEVTKSKFNGDINVSFDLTNNHKTLIILKPNPEGLKFVYAMNK